MNRVILAAVAALILPTVTTAQPRPGQPHPLWIPEACTTDALSGQTVRLDYTIPNLRPSGADGDVQLIYSPTHNWIRTNGLYGAVYQANRSRVRNFYNDVTVSLRNTSSRDMWEADCWRTSDSNTEIIRIVDKMGQWNIDRDDCDGEEDVLLKKISDLGFVLEEDVKAIESDGLLLSGSEGAGGWTDFALEPGGGAQASSCSGGGGSGGSNSCWNEWICIDVWVDGQGWVEYWCGTATICVY